jgi:cytochrome c
MKFPAIPAKTATILAPLAVVFGLGAVPALSQDAAAGEKVFKKCAGCHRIGDGAKNATGPVLTTVVGRIAGTFPGFRYSKSFEAAAAAGHVWTTDSIAGYIANPTAYLRKLLDDPRAKAKMRFKLKDEQARRDVVAYLASFAPAPETTMPATPDRAGIMLDTPGQLCVTNAAALDHLFAVESASGTRSVEMLAPGARLCVDSADGGKVSVFESADGFEGCTRLVAPGHSEAMYEYAEFDRCAWSSNSN